MEIVEESEAVNRSGSAAGRQDMADKRVWKNRIWQVNS
jgi:hypothetical protein